MGVWSKDLYTMVLSVSDQDVPLAVHGDAFKTLRFHVIQTSHTNMKLFRTNVWDHTTKRRTNLDTLNSPSLWPQRPKALRKVPSGLKIWIRLLPESATKMNPPSSTATPLFGIKKVNNESPTSDQKMNLGNLNCPSSVPSDPKVVRTFPFTSKIWINQIKWIDSNLIS